MKRSLLLLILTLAGAAIGVVTYHFWLSPRARIKSVVEDTARAFLANNQQAILDNISPEFEHRSITKPMVEVNLAAYFREFQSTKVILSDHCIQVRGNQAIDSTGAVVLASRQGERFFILGSFASPVPIAIRLKKHRQWQISGVEGLNLERF